MMILVIGLQSDRIVRAFKMPFSDQAITFDISVAFNNISYAVLLRKLTANGIPGRFFNLIYSFFSNRRRHVALVASLLKNVP